MAYNKITSHFSSSETFSEDRYFSYDNTTNKLGFVKFIDFTNSSDTSITGSGNNLYITGNLDLLNDLTSSRVIVNNSEIKFNNQTNYFVKRKNNSISINNNIELTGSVNVNETNALNGLTGSLINVDQNNTKLLNKISGINVNIVTEETTGLQRYKLTQASQESSVGITHLFLQLNTGFSDAKDSLIVTGSTVVQHYNNIASSAHPFANGQLRFSKFTNEHKEYIGTGKYHIFVIHTKNEANNGHQFRFYPALGANNTFDSSQIGSKYRIVIGDHKNKNMRRHDMNIFLPAGNTFIHEGGGQTQIQVLSERDAPKIGISFTIKCVDTNKWEII